MFVPTLPHWTSKRVVLMGDAAHGLSPHISAGGTLGIEDVLVFARLLQRNANLQEVLAEYEKNRVPQYRRVHELADAVEQANNAQEYAHQYAHFSHWMLNEGAEHSRI
jgi:salicylate hydroxylase